MTARRSRLAWLLAAVVVISACAEAPSRAQPGLYASPVAFVTAQAPPKPQPTATAPPLATPTLPPPTAAPKRLPIDTSTAIGLWNDQLSAQRPLTQVLDVAVGDGSAALRKGNPTLVSLAVRQVYFGSSSTLTDVKASKPQLLLYDGNKNVALATANKEPLLNIREAEVRSTLADDAANLVRAGGNDGIILDGVGIDLIRTDASPVFTGTKAFTEQQRRDAVEGLLRAVRAKLPDKLMLVSGFWWRDGAAFAVKPGDAIDLAALTDGVVIPEFLRAPGGKPGAFKKEDDWKKDIEFVGAASQNDRIVLAATRISATDVTTDAARGWLQYSVASYLIGKSGARSYFLFDAPAFPDLQVDPYLTAPIGAPSEAYAKTSSGLYRRPFSNGLVLVNPTGDAKRADLDRAYRTVSGVTVSAAVTMTANTGLILLLP